MKATSDRLLSVMLALSLLVPLAAFAALAWKSHSDVYAMAETRLRDTTDGLREHALKVFETNQLVLGHLNTLLHGRTRDEIANSRALQTQLVELVDQLDQLNSIWVNDRDGRVMLTSIRFPAPAVSTDDRDFHQALKERDRGLYISETFLGKTTGSRTFSLAVRRTGVDDLFDGVIAAALDVTYFLQFWASAKPGMIHSVELIRGDGSRLVRLPDVPIATGVAPDLMAALAGAERGRLKTASAVDGTERIHAWRKLGQFDAYLVGSIDPATIRGLWLRGLGLQAAFAIPASAVIFLTTLYAVRRARRERRMAEELARSIERRDKAEEQLRQSQKMETIGQLTGGVAHDFNNLLTIILGNLEILERQIDGARDSGRMQRALGFAKRGADRAAALTQSLLAFSRRQPLEPVALDPNNLLGSLSELLRRTLGEGITIETVGSAGLWRIHADPNQLESALLNLAVNARDAMPNGGKLTIETGNIELDERYANEAEVPAGQYVVISVTDTGTGMSPEVAARAFEPFFTTKEVGHGTGLGLSQVYGFVKQSGGHLRIYSEPGSGTAVKIYLPRLPGDAVAIEETQALPVVTAEPRGQTVLVVEDDVDVRAYSVSLFEELGFGVLKAGSAAEAFQVLDSHAKVALLFTDIGLPGGMNGRQLAEEVRRRRQDIKVLFTTGYAKNAIIHDGRLDAGVQLVTKPFTFAILAAKVRALLDDAPEGPTILLVEDEAMIRRGASEILNDSGFAVEEAASATEAMSKVTFLSGHLDAAIIDLGLPDGRGDHLAIRLRGLRPTLPILIATGQGTMPEELANDPLVSLIAKPYAAQELRRMLAALGVATASVP
jgi:signal transduction histidine kinase/CheY-like chemotaxis protein